MTEPVQKALLFGGLPAGYLREWEITADPELTGRKIGVRCEEVPHEELLARFEGLDDEGRAEADELADDLARRSLPVADEDAPSEAKLRKAVRLYLAMRGILRERDGDAVTVSGGPFYTDADLPVPCLAFGLMAEQGVPAACQCDLDALLTMMLLKRLTGWSSFMGGAYEAGGLLRLTHDVLPRRIGGPHAPMLPYRLAGYHGDLQSPTVHVEVPEGQPVTVARLTRDLEDLIVAPGTLVRCADLPRHCRNTLVLRVPRLAEVMAHVRGIQYHLVVGWGDHADALAEMARRADIGILPEELS
jgi:L-fucose isomerase-like protein